MRVTLCFLLLFSSLHVSAESKAPASDFSITLERSGCLGMCPWYSVRILGDGSVRYDGTAYVHVKGTHKKTIPVSDVNKLTRKLQDDDFLRWEEKTDLCVDYPEVRITANLHGQRKQVLEGCSAPGKILALAELIDTIAGTTNWVGNVREELIQTQRRNGQVVGQNILCPDDPCSNLEGATTASDEVSSGLIGKQITIRGKFSLGGKIGPYILLHNQQQIYLVPKSRSSGENFTLKCMATSSPLPASSGFIKMHQHQDQGYNILLITITLMRRPLSYV